MKLRVRNALIFAPDLVRAQAFYGDTLGLTLRDASDTYLRFHADDFELTVFLCDRSGSPEEYAQRAGSALVFTVPSVDEAAAELATRGVRLLHDAPVDGPLGRYVAFVDPFGVVHELMETPRQT